MRDKRVAGLFHRRGACAEDKRNTRLFTEQQILGPEMISMRNDGLRAEDADVAKYLTDTLLKVCANDLLVSGLFRDVGKKRERHFARGTGEIAQTVDGQVGISSEIQEKAARVPQSGPGLLDLLPRLQDDDRSEIGAARRLDECLQSFGVKCRGEIGDCHGAAFDV